ncbi:MAG: protein-L-isoaspartate(D-aspartate) O-methyltransferase [Deltaproteobacteria bacterium]|nr:protein-L-isoaspartate(D-aspartate) O-methyltransferase [Deltaproteobacteria bacterium]
MTKIVYYITFFLFTLYGVETCSAQEKNDVARSREFMVESQIIDRGVRDPAVIRAMKTVPRHLFVPEKYRALAYADHPLPIGEGQTISQPYIVAFMTEALKLKPDEKVLEIGTGSGYQAAVLAELVKDVYSIEIVEALGKKAGRTLAELGYANVHIKIGDGHKGWPQKAPFDAVIVTCAPEQIPGPLVEQLKEGGRLIIPVGRAGGVQKLVVGVRTGGQLKTEAVMWVRFVPMVADDE